MPFLNKVSLIKEDKSKFWILKEDLWYENCEDKIVIQEGFRTNLANIPRIFWCIISPIDEIILTPAILHDYLYTTETFYTRKDVDKLLCKAMKEKGANIFIRLLVYYSVRLFGDSHWKEETTTY